jgi:Adenylate cyclase associated (CAP) N terminal
MEDKLSSLIARLEKTVERLENVSSNPSSPTKTATSTPQPSTSQQSSAIAPLEALYKTWSDKAAATELKGVIDMVMKQL